MKWYEKSWSIRRGRALLLTLALIAGLTSCPIPPGPSNEGNGQPQDSYYTLTVQSGGSGRGTAWPPPPHTVAKGEACDIAAYPARIGFSFVNWTVISGQGVLLGDDASAATTVTLTRESATIQANFCIAVPGSDVTTLAGIVPSQTGWQTGGSNDGTGSAARFLNPEGVATDGTNLYVSDSGNNTIREVVIATAQVTTLAGKAGESGSADGAGGAARFYTPAGLATDGTDLYVADCGNDTIRKIVLATGEVTTLAGTALGGGSNDGTGAAARFRAPRDVAMVGANLYVTDSNNNTIRKIVIATGEVTTLAGTAPASGSSDGIGADARFMAPCGIVADGQNLYVSDCCNNTIRKIVISSAEVTTLAGKAGESGSGDGIVDARFNCPLGLTTDGTALYVTEFSNRTVRKILITTGAVTTIAGTAGGYWWYLSHDGNGSGAQFCNPWDIETYGTSLYVADTNAMRVVTKPP